MFLDHTYIILEAGSVHDGSFGNALKLIELASTLGADAIKFQTHIPESESTIDAPSPSYFRDETRFEYFHRTGFSRDQWHKLKAHADAYSIDFLSSPFSIDAVSLLEDINIPYYKIPSGEVTNLPMLEVVGQTKKPVFLSSGMSNWQELDRAVDTLRKHHNNIVVMQCTSQYPCSYESVGLNILHQMKKRWNVPTGYSDHTKDNYAIFAAVSMGASVVEKHFTFSRDMYGSDAQHSAEPAQIRDLITGIRAIDLMRSHPVDKNDIGPYHDMKNIFEKSIVSQCFIAKGTVIDDHMLTMKKPGSGLSSYDLDDVLGKTALVDISPDQLIKKNMLK